jgi:hypothetical protein
MFYGSDPLRRPGFNPTPVLVSFVVEKWHRNRVFFPCTLVWAYNYHSTDDSRSFFHVSPTCVSSAVDSVVIKHTSTNSWLSPGRVDLCPGVPWLGYLPLQRIKLDTLRIRAACYILQFDVPLVESTALGRPCSLGSGFLILFGRIAARFIFSAVFGSERLFNHSTPYRLTP